MRASGVVSALIGVLAASVAVVPGEAVAQKRQRDLITREEILNSAHLETDIYQVIRSLRPHFLAPPRGVRTIAGAPPAAIVVYVNGNRHGEVGSLKLIMASGVEEVRYLEPSRAEDQFGVGHSGGAVLVKLITAPRRDTIKPPA